MRLLLTVVFVLLLAVSSAWAQQTSSSDLLALKEEKSFVALHVRERQQLIVENSRKQAKSMATDILNKEMPEASKEKSSPKCRE